MSKAWFLILCLDLGCRGSAGASTSPDPQTQPAPGVTFTGAGSTFVQPLMDRWASRFHDKRPGILPRYRGLGSGTGIKLISEGQVDFGATDVAMTDEEHRKAPGIVHIPVTSGAVAVIFKLQGISGLKLTPEVLAGIYLGAIKLWSDPRLEKINLGSTLPNIPIVVAHRREASGTSAIFTDYLSKVSPAWKSRAGAGTNVNWPAGLSAVGNEGVSELVLRTEGAIGYVELGHATKFQLPLALLRNRDGFFVEPTPTAVSAATDQATIPDDFRASITDPPGRAAWPISGLSWVLLRAEQPDKQKGEALLNFLWWTVHEGQEESAHLQYAPLPPVLVERIEARLRGCTVQENAFVPPAAQVAR